MSDTIQLLHGDCLDLMKGLPDGSVDMICADLPYGTTCCHWDVRIPMAPLWEQFWRITKPNAAICLFAQQPFATDLINAARKWFRYEWVMVKHRALGFLNANRMPLRAHELVLVFYRSLPTYRPQKTGDGKPHRVVRKALPSQIYSATHAITTWSDGKRFPRDVIEARGINKPLHPTEKPVEVLELLVNTYTEPKGGGRARPALCWTRQWAAARAALRASTRVGGSSAWRRTRTFSRWHNGGFGKPPTGSKRRRSVRQRT